MTEDATAEDVAGVDRLIGKRFELQIELDDLNRQFKDQRAALEADHAARQLVLQTEIDELNAHIDHYIESRRSRFIKATKKSFATMAAVFKFRRIEAKTKVVDSKGLMEVARAHGLVRLVADPPSRKWKFNQKKALAAIKKDSRLRQLFAPFLETTPSGESLTAKPNTGHVVVYDGKRLSPPSVKIK